MMTYFEAIEAERSEREALIPSDFFESRTEMSMENLIESNYELLNTIVSGETTHSQLGTDTMNDLIESADDGYLPYCFEHSGLTSIVNNMAYSTLIHEYNLWVLNDYLRDIDHSLPFILLAPNTDRIDKLAGIKK
jgi:hypothetical protein